MKVNTGDIYLVRFHPGYGNELKKYRPAVIISDKVTRIDSRFVLLAPLTTKLKISNPKQEIIINHESLDKKSLLLTWYMRTIDSTRLVRKIGKLSNKDKKSVSKAVTSLFL